MKSSGNWVSVASACEMAIKMANWPIVVVAVRESTIRAGLQASIFLSSLEKKIDIISSSFSSRRLSPHFSSCSVTYTCIFVQSLCHSSGSWRSVTNCKRNKRYIIWKTKRKCLLNNCVAKYIATYFRAPDGVGHGAQGKIWKGHIVTNSVVVPNTLNLDPDPECCPNLDPDPDLGVYYQFKKLRENIFLKTTNFFFF